MRVKQHKTMALILAFLVLISTTGISMNMMLCNCTGQQYLAMLASKLDLECCKIKAAKQAKKSCCATPSPQAHTTSTCHKKSPFLANKDCCSPIFKYSKANINLNLSHDLELPTVGDPLPWVYFSPPVYYSAPIVLPQIIAVHNNLNKAPPRYSSSIQNWFQIYRC